MVDSQRAIFVPSATVPGSLELDPKGRVTRIEIEPQVIAQLGSGELRAAHFIPLAEIPQSIRDAFLSIEDQRFYSHFGVDPIGIARAIATNLRAGRLVQGGSTLTQQLAKNLFFTPEKTLLRKFKEALAAFSLELRLSKDQILEMYLNEVYLGQEGSVAIHGIAEAANTFFGKRLTDLSVAESAMIAGIVKAPSYFAPRRHLTRAQRRKEVVLAAMHDNDAITIEQLKAALAIKVKITKQPIHRNTAAYFVAALKRELQDSFNFEGAILSGLSVYTAITLELQQCAEQALTSGLEKLEKSYPALRGRRGQTTALEGGLVAIEPFSGKIRAWSGGRNFSINQFDHVSQGRRQIGSTIKPFLYLTALDGTLNEYKVATATTVLPDRPMQVDISPKQTWEPENFDHEYRGDVTLRYALERSLNMPAVYLAQRIGIPAMVRTVRNFRLMQSPPAVPALALGAADSTLLDLTAAFGALANGGIYVAPRLFQSAIDNNGNRLATSSIYEDRVAEEAPVYVLTNILEGVVERGTAKAIRSNGFNAPVAGKTGTSNEARDAWFVGFTPSIVAGVWVGFDNNRPIGITGGVAAAPIWADFMKCSAARGAIAANNQLSFVPPPNIVTATINSRTGARVTKHCPADQADKTVQEVFVRGTEPIANCEAALQSPITPEQSNPTPSSSTTPRGKREQPLQRERGFWDRVFG